MDTNILNGFEVFDDLLPGANIKQTDNKIDLDGVTESLSDEDLDKIKNSNKQVEEKETEDIDDKPVEEPTKKSKEKKEEPVEDISNDDKEDIEDVADQSTVVTGFFDTIAEQFGWDDVTEDEKPKSAEALVQYFRDVIEENSKPEYASEEVEALDKFVRNGGNLRDYFSIDNDIDLENISLEDESNQKVVLKEFLKEKGFTPKQIDKKLTKYEDAGLLEDEAEDALEALKDIKTKRKEQLLAQQEKSAREAENKQREFFNNVVDEIKGMDSIYGINIPEKDKKTLLEYIFKPGSDGMTKYQKDYAKSLKNLIASAYFTMKGDTLIDIAKKKGKQDALDNFKNSLIKNSGVSKKSKVQVVNTNDDYSIWNAFSRRLRVA